LKIWAPFAILGITRSGFLQFRGLRDTQCTSMTNFNTIWQRAAESLMT